MEHAQELVVHLMTISKELIVVIAVVQGAVMSVDWGLNHLQAILPKQTNLEEGMGEALAELAVEAVEAHTDVAVEAHTDVAVEAQRVAPVEEVECLTVASLVFASACVDDD